MLNNVIINISIAFINGCVIFFGGLIFFSKKRFKKIRESKKIAQKLLIISVFRLFSLHFFDVFRGEHIVF